ncbi:MAG TPA: hypothetical protein VL523_00750 [Terriglobia bacterium]|nr:hypothetical protein [Terriglobia bacterium]
MKTVVVEVDARGSTIDLVLKVGAKSGQAVLVLSENVEIKGKAEAEARSYEGFRTFVSDDGFPPRRLTEETIIQILREHGGSLTIRDQSTGWNIYDEIAARLGVSIEARRRLTDGGEPAWRPEVGYARKNLEQSGIIAPTQKSGRGVWELAQP